MNGWKSEFPDKDAKIHWTFLYMQTSSAKIWHDYIVALMYKRQQWFLMSDELSKEIDQKFGDMDKRTTQSLKIRTIQQGDRSADEHVQEFKKAVLGAAYEGYPLVVEFKHLLNTGLWRRLSELWPMPVTMQQWYDEAIMSFYRKVNRTVRKPPQHGQQGQGQGQEQGSSLQQGYQWQFFRNQTPPQYGQCQNTGQPQHDPNAMDVDRNQAQSPSMKCFKCNGLGHMAKECRRNLDIRGMMYKEMAEHFEAAATAAKDCEEFAKRKDFPTTTQWEHSYWGWRTSLKDWRLTTPIQI